ncbi:flavodoxin domain-containing protein [Lutispora thermophila]|uniref:Protoporphyrinogen IX oxidase, menaquinone-dependent (Flavodoxin domain) n=1 Tax=Lutispora thermophila DSM 19022 TaxID=1122184 RepID=A0A1M6B7M6_9FIRM|nr:flavodoxin domain-containing protein [Lutispora thermophila]SHI44483.1 Protoporphyrinogen IX oxidase, menaquinone-dependent (flavodoxin domain) [Lutispora thermophila DSM 19022]
MSNIIVIYRSKYGSTKKYAEWLAEELSADLIETKKASIELIEKYDVVILGGGIYATGIAGISFLKKHYEKLKNKKLIVFAVGASPYDEKAMKALREHNLRSELSRIPVFYCRGAWNEGIMSWKDKVLCNLLKKAVAKKDPSTYEPWEAALMEAIGRSCDWTDKEYIKGIVEYVKVNIEL